MATESRESNAAVTAPLPVRSGDSNSLFQLVRLLERHAQKQADARDEDVTTLGDDGLPTDEVVRFKSNLNMAFSAGAYEQLRTSQSGVDGDKHEILVNFMGLLGTSGVLPQHYTRLAQVRNKQKDYALSGFLDLFNHRLVSLYYRSWVKYRVAAQYEIFRSKNKVDPFSQLVKGLSGNTDRTISETQQFYSGYFSRKVRSGTNLQMMLKHFTNTDVDIKYFQGRWLEIAKEDRSRLSSVNTSRSLTLGQGLPLGKRCWDMQSAIKLILGPISHELYQRIGPGSKKYQQMTALIKAYVPINMQVKLEYLVESDGRFNCRLDGQFKLGRNAWLISKKESNYKAVVSF
ncbi:type VI secretion system baseplate subunit TssG [Aurantivibrio plasticivorans]